MALGAAHGIPTPVNAELLRVAEEMAAAGEPPASRPADGLVRVAEQAV